MNEMKKIAVVEDDRDFVESISMILESAGYDIWTADCSERFFALLEKDTPDLILLDIMMKSLTEGFSILYDLKSSPRYGTIPVVIVSAIDKHTGFSIDTSFLEVDDYLEKPLNPQLLLDCVERLTVS